MLTNRLNTTPHPRKCWDCGNVAMHAEAFVPHCLCTDCGSQDTRRIKEPERLEPFLELRGFRRNHQGNWELTIAEDEQSRLAVLFLENHHNPRAYDIELHTITKDDQSREMVFLSYAKPVSSIQQIERFLAALEEVCQ